MMNNWKKIITGGALLAVLLISSCDGEINQDKPNNNKYFSYDLRGTWFSNDTSVYSGELIIAIDRITINGFFESQTPAVGGDDNNRPFKDFLKGVPFKGYSEAVGQSQGIIFIEIGGVLQQGIPYTYVSEPLAQKNFLRFTFGNRIELMERQR
jgi:hypothetical protein